MRGWGAWLCALWCVIACGIIAARVQTGRAFDTDLQSLLPQEGLEPVIRGAIADAGAVASRRISILVSGGDTEQVHRAAEELERALKSLGFESDAGAGEQMARWLFANRDQLICELDPQKFKEQAVLQDAQVSLYAPASPISGALLQRDPFLLTLRLGKCLAPRTAGALSQSALISGSLSGSAFDLTVQRQTSAVFATWRQRWSHLEVARQGAVFDAAYAANRARDEVTLFASIFSVILIALIWLVLRKPQALVGTLMVTAAGAAGSLAATFLVFPSVHVIVFVFGSALTGITSDYAVHYLATGPQTAWAPPSERLRLISRPLAVCAITTAIGFGSLALFNVPVFYQIAVFSVSGILTAWWFTVALLPLMDRTAKNASALQAWWNRLEKPFKHFRGRRRFAFVGLSAVAGIACIGGLRLHILDDVRFFQARSRELASEEALLRERLGLSFSPVFLLSYGADGDEARRREETVLSHWPQAAVKDAFAVSRFDPSSQRRRQNSAALQSRLYEPHLAKRLEELGLEAANSTDSGAPDPPLPRVLAGLEGEAGGVHYLVAPLGRIAASQPPPRGKGAIRVDPAARYSQVFATFRIAAAAAAASAFAACAVLLLALYRSWRAVIILIPAALGLITAIAIPAALGQPISFFSLAALLVVLGASVDHSVFLFEATPDAGEEKELAVFLTALTTILSMGLLSLSGTYPVRSFGITVAVGVATSYLFSFIPGLFRGEKVHARA